MFGTPLNNGLTLTKVIGGLSKTLGIAKEIIPLYKEAKPMLKNARTIMSVLKDMNTNSKPPKNNFSSNNLAKTKKTSLTSPNYKVNSPRFFL